MKSLNINKDSFKQKLDQLIKQEINCANALLKSMKGETIALSNLDDSLISINNLNKQKLIRNLQGATQQRIELMEENGLDTNPLSIKAMHKESKIDNELCKGLTELISLANKCFDENRLILQLINRRSTVITQTLSNLTPSAELKTLRFKENAATSKKDNSKNIDIL